MLAINLGLTVAATNVGLTVDVLQLLQFTVEERLQIVFALAGMKTRTLQTTGGVLRAELMSKREPQLSFLAMLLPYLPHEVAVAHITVAVGDRKELWETDIDVLRSWSVEQDPAKKHLLFLESLARTRRNKTPAISEDTLRKAVAIAVAQAIEVANRDWSTAITCIKPWSSLAKNGGDHDLVRCLASVTAGLADLAAGARPTPPFFAAVERLRSWTCQATSIEPFADEELGRHRSV